MVSRCLVTTALEETWPDNKDPVLFLGKWCTKYDRSEQWDQRDSEMVPYHWDDRQKISQDYVYLQSVYESFLPKLAEKLNDIHGARHGLRYWRIIAGPWLNCFIQTSFDRFESLKRAKSLYDITHVNIINADISHVTAQSMPHFTDLILSDWGNEYLYGEIVKKSGLFDWTSVQRSTPVPAFNSLQKPAVKRSLKSKIINIYRAIVSALSSDKKAIIFNSYLSFWDDKKLQLKLGQIPQIWHTGTLNFFPQEKHMRDWDLGPADTDFETLLSALIPGFIPTAYLEGHKQIVRQAHALGWPQKAKFIWTSMSHNNDEIFKVWVAEAVEKESKLVIGQHGGLYGVADILTLEEHEIKISDAYLTWGWTKNNVPKGSQTVPIGQLKNKRPLGVNHAQQPHGLLITCAIPRYSYFLRSMIIAGQWLDYFDDQLAFIGDLPEPIRQAFLVRLYSDDYGWGQERRWRDKFDDINLDFGTVPIDQRIASSRVVVTTYNATSYLETFTMDVPTVMFWNPKHWELRQEAIPFFDDLVRVGIMHHSPQSASEHVSQIWDDVDQWWSSPDVRQVIKKFSDQYSHLPEDLLNSLKTAFTKIAP
ncbi:LIC12162 family protein [Terasakiella sp. A23]|uniref:LIC12162 family transferase n=1 Tax=Terasakiella sp. FCG-A23 TaxID=3080561 RepID=UPI002952EA2F|nr:LIC12162 family protein [Terasakiella sp. A23]MDV7340794.1 LIC12162 family protein [Terasakiella sp. A23]